MKTRAVLAAVLLVTLLSVINATTIDRLASISEADRFGLGDIPVPSKRASQSMRHVFNYTDDTGNYTRYDRFLFLFFNSVYRSHYYGGFLEDCIALNVKTPLNTERLSDIDITVIYKDCANSSSSDMIESMKAKFDAGDRNITHPFGTFIITFLGEPVEQDAPAVTGKNPETDFPLAAALAGTLIPTCLIIFGCFLFIVITFLALACLIIVVLVVIVIVLLGVGILVLVVGAILHFFVYDTYEPPEAGDEDQDLWSENEEDL